MRVPLLAAGLAVAALALPLDVDHSLIVNHEFDSGLTGAMATSEVDTISAYIAATPRAPATSSPPRTRSRSAR